MILQIAIGTLMILVTVTVAAGLIVMVDKHLRRTHQIDASNRARRLFRALIASTFTMTMTVTIISWLWAFLLLGLGVFSDTESALYFSLVSFTTLGFGDVILSSDWRLLSGFIAADGFLVFGLGTAYILDAMRTAGAPDEKKELSLRNG